MSYAIDLLVMALVILAVFLVDSYIGFSSMLGKTTTVKV
jgi:hypothetical protein